MGGENDSASEGKSIWSNAISPSSIEDLVKNAKLRLEGAVTTSAKFAGGGFNDARREYTLLAMLFGIIEQYPSQVRWKNSAPIVRMHMVRVAASSKVGSPQAYNEAKLRLAELADLINGTTITDKTPLDELNWGEALDRVPLMQLLEWALRENMIKMSASPKEFQENSDDILRFGELIGTIGEMLVQKGMTDADDAEYVRLTRSMIDLAQKAVQSVKLNNPEGGREAAALLNQSCDACHNVYR